MAAPDCASTTLAAGALGAKKKRSHAAADGKLTQLCHLVVQPPKPHYLANFGGHTSAGKVTQLWRLAAQSPKLDQPAAFGVYSTAVKVV